MITSQLSITTNDLAGDLTTLIAMFGPCSKAQVIHELTLSATTLKLTFERGNTMSLTFNYMGRKTVLYLNELVCAMKIPFVEGEAILISWTLMGMDVEAHRLIGPGSTMVFANPKIEVAAAEATA